MMKQLTLQLIAIAAVVIVFSATDALAQRRIDLDANGKARISATVGPRAKAAWVISGKVFNRLSLRQTNGEKFKYEIKRGNSFLSSGHTTGSNIQIQSDGQSIYTITIINEVDKARKIELSVVASGE